MNKELENRFLILFALKSLGGRSTKRDALDCIEANDWINLSSQDTEILESRNEPKWRNELAFVRQHLISDGCLSSSVKRGVWEITAEGDAYLNDLTAKIDLTSNYIRITNVIRDTVFSANPNLYLSDQISQDILNDSNIQNESVERKVKFVKRIQAVVKKIKNKYQSKCQLENCGFTFVKSNGENYSEAHHLVQLSDDGSQDESNVVILCPNHHRMFHYSDLNISGRNGAIREISINGITHNIIYK